MMMMMLMHTDHANYDDGDADDDVDVNHQCDTKLANPIFVLVNSMLHACIHTHACI